MNQLLHNHQVAMLQAQHAQSPLHRETSLGLVGHFARQITDWRDTEGLPGTGWPRDERAHGLVRV